MPGTELPVLRVCYAVCGTELAYGATRCAERGASVHPHLANVRSPMLLRHRLILVQSVQCQPMLLHYAPTPYGRAVVWGVGYGAMRRAVLRSRMLLCDARY
eukprot:1676143-Rhodomonas_salina.1